MPRLPRYGAPGMAQHVIQRGNNRCVVFARTADYQFFRECLRSACERHECRVHAYVLMTNHVHLLATPADDTGLSRVMQTVGRRYVRYFNDVYGRTGTLWEGRYRASLVQSDRYLFACYRYIELNPVRAGLVGSPRDYPWSSYAVNAYGSNDPVVTPHGQYEALGDDPAARRAGYRSLFALELGDGTLNAIRDATNKGWVLGTRQFRDDLAARLGRRTEPISGARSAKRNDSTRL